MVVPIPVSVMVAPVLRLLVILLIICAMALTILPFDMFALYRSRLLGTSTWLLLVTPCPPLMQLTLTASVCMTVQSGIPREGPGRTVQRCVTLPCILFLLWFILRTKVRPEFSSTMVN